MKTSVLLYEIVRIEYLLWLWLFRVNVLVAEQESITGEQLVM